jgi:hypothetical protein
VTGGQVHDSKVVEEVLNATNPPFAVSADKACNSQKVRQQIKDEGALPVIPSRSTAAKKAYCPKRILPVAPQDRELLLPHQGLTADRHPLRQTRQGLPRCRRKRRRARLNQVVSPDPNTQDYGPLYVSVSWH